MEIFIIILSIVLNFIFVIITHNQNRKDLKHICENTKIYNLLIKILNKKTKIENSCVEDDLKNDQNLNHESKKTEYIFDKYMDMILRIFFILSDIMIILIIIIYGDFYIVISLLLVVGAYICIMYSIRDNKISMLSVKLLIYLSSSTLIIQLFSIDVRFSNENVYFIILILINSLMIFISKGILWIFKNLLSYISNVIDNFFEFESKFKEKNFSLIFIAIVYATWDAYLLFMFNIMKFEYIKIIQTECTVFLFIFSIDAIVRLLALIEMRNKIAYRKGFNLIFKMLVYVIVYVLIINMSLNYSISEYNPNSFANSNNNSYKCIELKKNILYNSSIDNHSDNNMPKRINDNVSVIIEIDSDGKLILDKNIVGNMIKTKKPLGVLNAFYYTCISMFTIGYGDITPVSWYAKLESIIMSFTSVILLVVFINLFINLSGKNEILDVEKKE